MLWLVLSALLLGLPTIFYLFFIADARKKRTWKNVTFPSVNIQKFSENFYVFSAKNTNDPLPRNMVVYKINDKDLLLHSVVAMNEGRQKKSNF